MSCSDLPLGIAPDSNCVSVLLDALRCAANGEECVRWERDLWDDLESGDGRIPRISGRSGSWETLAANPGRITPDPFTPLAEGALGSSFSAAFSVAASEAENDWANAVLPFASWTPYDASEYAGVEFLARGTGPLYVRLDAPASSELTWQTKKFELSREWGLHQLLFDDPAILADFDTSQALTLRFEPSWDAPMPYEFAVDEVVLLRRPASSPTGAGGSAGGEGTAPGGAAGRSGHGGNGGHGPATNGWNAPGRHRNRRVPPRWSRHRWGAYRRNTDRGECRRRPCHGGTPWRGRSARRR